MDHVRNIYGVLWKADMHRLIGTALLKQACLYLLFFFVGLFSNCITVWTTHPNH